MQLKELGSPRVGVGVDFDELCDEVGCPAVLRGSVGLVPGGFEPETPVPSVGGCFTDVPLPQGGGLTADDPPPMRGFWPHFFFVVGVEVEAAVLDVPIVPANTGDVPPRRFWAHPRLRLRRVEADLAAPLACSLYCR